MANILTSIDQLILNKVGGCQKERWIGYCILLTVYLLRVLYLKSHYIVTYILGVYLVHGSILWATPKGKLVRTPFTDEVDEFEIIESEEDDDVDYENSPFIRNLPEYELWMFYMKITLAGCIATFFNIFDIPVFYPLLLFYLIAMSILTVIQVWKHAIKHKYNPFKRPRSKRNYD